MPKLFKCTLRCKIKGIPDRIEYLRAKNEDILISSFESCENIEHSMYYGYKWIDVKPIKLGDFPEIITIEVECS